MTAARTDRQGRAPAAANAAVGLAVLLLVAAIALPASQTPPPAIAEFSPNPQEQITDAPPEQSSEFGEGGEGGAGGTATATTTTMPDPALTTTTSTVVDRGKVRRCVGDPPRQTEDPHSPPCVNYWDGDNGGATWQGVTANEVRIAVPMSDKFLDGFLKHFNSRFEFYGRKLVGVPVGQPFTVDQMIAKAVEVDEEVQAFASTTVGDLIGQEYVYYDELARRRVISVNGHPSMADEAHLARHHPYQWSYLPLFDVMSRNKAEWACTALAGKRADFAGGSERAKTRKFALVVTVTSDGSRPDTRPMKAVLDGCGIDLDGHEYEIVIRHGDDAAGFQEANDLVTKMQLGGVTSVFCECHTQSSGLYLAPAATKQGWYPEWLIGTYMSQMEDISVQLWDGAQIEHHFGLQWWNKQLTPEESPWFWALRDADPNFEFDSRPWDYYNARWLWNNLSVLAAGIQLAGPNLTPETFAAGLQRAKWPNPNPGQAPYWQASVGFQGDHSFIDDATLGWASKSQPSTWDNIPGTICYAKRGVRYRFGSWPSDYAGLFQLPCH